MQTSYRGLGDAKRTGSFPSLPELKDGNLLHHAERKQIWIPNRYSNSGLPIQRPIPMWIGAQVSPNAPVLKRIAAQANGWFVLATPEKFDDIKAEIDQLANELLYDIIQVSYIYPLSYIFL